MHGLADARRLLDAGIGLLPDSADPLRFDLVLARETVLDRIGDRAAQRADLDALERLETSVADDPVRRVRLLLTRCRWSFHQSEYAAQGVIALAAIDLARSHHLDDLEAEARLWLGKGLTWEGKHQEARDALEAAPTGIRRTCRSTGRPQTIGHTTWNGGVPATQTILLHVNDTTLCHGLPGRSSDTCFVLPGGPLPTSAISTTIHRVKSDESRVNVTNGGSCTSVPRCTITPPSPRPSTTSRQEARSRSRRYAGLNCVGTPVTTQQRGGPERFEPRRPSRLPPTW